MNEQGYPLLWPQGWPRAATRDYARFRSRGSARLSLTDALGRLDRQLGLLGASACVISTNIEPRLDGRPRAGQPAPSDPGAAVYFTRRRRRLVLACDAWTTTQDNLAAIAAHIDALRAIERYRVGTLDRAFTGYLALSGPRAWRVVLEVGANVDLAAVKAAYRALALKHHPDHGGAPGAMAELNAAMEAAEKELGGGR